MPRAQHELGLWGFEYFARYLRAMIFKLTPQPHRVVQVVLDAFARLEHGRDAPASFHVLRTTPPSRVSNGTLARCAANAICDVVDCWRLTHWEVQFVRDSNRDRVAYARAYREVQTIQQQVLEALGADVLYVCAVEACWEGPADRDRFDAAMAAITAGEFALAMAIAADRQA